MAAHKRTPTEIARDAIWIEDKYVQGHRNTKRLAEMLAKERRYRISGDQIKKDLDKMRAALRARFGAQLKGATDQTLATLEAQERELWAAWFRSQEDEETETEKTKQMAVVHAGAEAAQLMPAFETEKGKKRVGRAGDPSFMRLILDVQIRRCKLLGLDLPQKVEVDHSGSIAATVDVDRLNLDLDTRKKLLAAVRESSNGAGRV